MLRIHHVQITIPPDTEAQARAFYCGLLGLAEIEKPESLRDRGGLWLSLGTQELHLGVETGVDRSATRAHIAYYVTSLAEWREKFSRRRISIREAIPIPGYERFMVRDPFGNQIEFIADQTGQRERE